MCEWRVECGGVLGVRGCEREEVGVVERGGSVEVRLWG